MATFIRLTPCREPCGSSSTEAIEWVCSSLGLVSGRDTERTAAAIFRHVVEATRRDERVTSERLARELALTRAAVNHHLRGFIDAGLLVRRKRAILLRANTLEHTLDALRRDTDRLFDDLLDAARRIDEQLHRA